jgi:glycosyltransferase involved in cell wall biosynthesis
MAASSVVAVPSLQEGFGLVAVEALAAARPVVATAAGGLTQILEDGETALLVPPGDAAGLARAIAALLEDPNRGRAMGARGQVEASARFALRPWIRRIEDLYEELVGDGGDGGRPRDSGMPSGETSSASRRRTGHGH